MMIERVKQKKRSYTSEIFRILTLSLILSCSGFGLCAQDKDSTNRAREISRKETKVSLQVYMRVIQSAAGAIRMDQNIVPNFRVNQWLRVECGLRFGETTEKFNSYYGYKLELQSKSFFRIVRVVARLSDKLVRHPAPSSSRSNYLIATEARFILSPAFSGMVAGGYVFTYGKNNVIDFKPITNVGTINYPTFKLGLLYRMHKKNSFELVYGAYDVFNPYPLSTPFFQFVFDHEISPRIEWYSYFRYQYNHHVDVPLNYFFGIGVKTRLQRRG